MEINKRGGDDGIKFMRDVGTMTTKVIDAMTESERYAILERIHTKVQTQIMSGAVIAVQVLFDIIQDPSYSAQARLAGAFGILDRAGHSGISKRNNSSMVPLSQNVNDMTSDDIMKRLQEIESRLVTKNTDE